MATTAAPVMPAQDPRTQKFQWDYDVPPTPFWSDLEFTAGRNFLTCFSTAELNNLTFDDSLSKDAKLHFLLDKVSAKLTERETQCAPKALYEVDFDAWQDLLVAIGTMQDFLNDIDGEEDTLQKLLEHGRDGGSRNMSAVYMMAELKLKRGEYAQAEALIREVLPFLLSHKALGVDSPQVLAAKRRLIRALWMMGRKEEAETLISEVQALVEGMENSQSVKYQDEEREMLRDLVADLKA